mmetsp:Transcript_1046/g.4276  ORF Transcript_1046/g.4276 Transcript_1046/m.4276 type:complete len:206 (+) Transcript_1046:1095-1712(+)
MLHRSLVVEVKRKLGLELQQRFLAILADVRDIGVSHEAEEVQDENHALAQNIIRLAAVRLELAEVLALRAAHGLHHLLAQLHRRWENFRIASHDETKVNVEHPAVRREHQVIEVTIANSQDVGDHTVPRTALDERHERLVRATVRPVGIRVVQGNIPRQRLVLSQDIGNGLRRDKLDQTGVAAGGQHPIWGELEVQVLTPQQAIH